jgi:hypothetical protein
MLEPPPAAPSPLVGPWPYRGEQNMIQATIGHGRRHLMLDKILPKNEHPAERAVRVIAGIAILSLVFVGPKTLWGLIGIVPILTGALGSCPLYTVLGINTCPAQKD